MKNEGGPPIVTFEAKHIVIHAFVTAGSAANLNFTAFATFHPLLSVEWLRDASSRSVALPAATETVEN